MIELEIQRKEHEKAVLIAVVPKGGTDRSEEFLDELEFLARTLSIETVKKFKQALDRADSRHYVGKGKLEEIRLFIEEQAIDVAIFDDELTPSQLRNLENELKIKIYDRSLLILDIFLERAKTSQARLQVELARYQYLLPRLTRMWTHLERQRGGTGTRGGAGEKEIETDKRIINDKISLLKKKLEKTDQQAVIRRKNREQIVRVALVGYTNVGKSTLMNVLSKSEAFAEDKLFATVDSLVRKVVLETVPFLLTDTVGFIRKLPHSLIESFKSTLDEVREADILLHVVDFSSAHHEEQIQVVQETLAEIGAANKTTLMIYNKIDLLEGEPGTTEKDQVFISARSKENMDTLRSKLMEHVQQKHRIIYPNHLKKEYF